MEYQIQITESLRRLTTVSAASENEAVELVRQYYKKEQIILGSEDFANVDFSIKSQKYIISQRKMISSFLMVIASSSSKSLILNST